MVNEVVKKQKVYFEFIKIQNRLLMMTKTWKLVTEGKKQMVMDQVKASTESGSFEDHHSDHT